MAFLLNSITSRKIFKAFPFPFSKKSRTTYKYVTLFLVKNKREPIRTINFYKIERTFIMYMYTV